MSRVEPDCKADGCTKPAYCKGFCRPHYMRFYRYGDPLAGSGYRRFTNDFVEYATHFDGKECLRWPFSLASTGYGGVRIGGKTRCAHAVICERAHGPKPSKMDHAAHSCGNRWCCNPQHLRWASPKENAHDKAHHGRCQNGQNSPTAKLSDADVEAIKRMAVSTPVKVIAQQFGVNRNYVYQIINGRARALKTDPNRILYRNSEPETRWQTVADVVADFEAMAGVVA